MRTQTKLWLIIASSLMLIGCILFACIMSIFRWDFTKLSTVKYETNTYEIDEVFNDVSIHTDTADITFALSDDETCKVDCYEEENAKHSVTVEEGTLTVKLIDERSISDYIHYIGINIGSPKITIYLPKMEYTSLFIDESTGDIDIPKEISFKNIDISLSTGDVHLCASASEAIRIKASTGDICVENITTGSLDLSVSTGDVTVAGVNCKGGVTVGVSTGKAHLSDITCQTLTSNGSTGDLSLKNVISAEKFLIRRSTGDIKFSNSDAYDISVKTDTGDVTGNFLTDKFFVVQTNTGDVDVPQTATGGKCEITTNTGDIKIAIG